MKKLDSIVKNKMGEFHHALTTIAWGIAGYVISEQSKKLADGLVRLYIKAANPPSPKKKSTVVNTNKTKKMILIDSRSGTWNRGGDSYRIVGLGKKIGTYELVSSRGRKITSTTSTLLSRWRHTP